MTRTADTRGKLLQATIDVLAHDGVTVLSARTIAARADVNQALIFYHFGTVDALVDAACREEVTAAVARYKTAFDRASSFAQLLQVGQELRVRERERGSVRLMAQLMAAGQSNPAYAEAARYGLGVWTREVEAVVTRLLADSLLAEVVEAHALALTISSGFLGVQLFEGVDPDGAAAVLAGLEQLGAALSKLDDLPSVAQKAVRAALRHRSPKVSRPPVP